MIRLLALTIFVALLIVPVTGQEIESLRDRLVRRIDARLNVEMKRVRAALIEEIDKVLAEEGEAPEAPMPAGFPELLDDIEKARREIRRSGPVEKVVREESAEPAGLGAEVEPVPEVLHAQLGLPKSATVVTRVPKGSVAKRVGIRVGDILLSVLWTDENVTEVVVFRSGKRLTLGGGK